ncbi:HNH endonuclease [Polaribacter phage P12002S]|uniref:HNH endonuclease n=1 Tax=Polaribacter phage P12002S TaxID=1647387 RepID=A0A0F7IND1_9CAUD|nr:HNH endonuclease [Polaribacter phage P12002S]AKG94317.1 HNH endonuclease [Polaribacter phage P12002S]
MKKDIRQKVWKKYDCKCAYCGNDLKYDKMQVDHINAKYLGGKDDVNNYNPSCRECNFYKSTFTIEGFRKQIATILDRVKKPFIVRLALKYGLISFKPFDGLFYFEKHKPKALFINGVGKCVLCKKPTEKPTINYCDKCLDDYQGIE